MMSFFRKNANIYNTNTNFSHHEFSVNELKSLEYRDHDVFLFFPVQRYSTNVDDLQINEREWILWSIRVQNDESVYVRSCK